MKILNDLLPKSYQQELYNLLSSANFPWYYSPTSVPTNPDNFQWAVDDNTVDTSQFVHTFYYNNQRLSDFYNIIQPILLFAEYHTGEVFNKVHRVKANLLTKNQSIQENQYTTPHTDEYLINSGGDSKYKTLLYYVNDSDGETTFFKERFAYYTRYKELTLDTKIKPTQGTCAIFDSNIFHCSKPPSKFDNRIVINIVLEK